MEKRRFSQRLEVVETELVDLSGMVDQYKNDITELENKLKSAREKQRMLVQRHIRAQHKKRARQEIRRADSTEVIKKFEEMENHIERMEAEADLLILADDPALKPPLMIWTLTRRSKMSSMH